MVASYTANGRFTKQGTGDNSNTWGTILNSQVFDLVDQAIFGVAEIDVTGSSDVTLTTANGLTDESRNATLVFTGVLSADIDVLIPSVEKQYFLHAKQTGGNITVKISGQPTSVLMIPGSKKIIYTDGIATVDVVDIDLTPYMEKSENLADVNSVSDARDNLGLEDLAITTRDTLLQSIYPVGSMYFNTAVNTNPTSFLGFGTWVQFGRGRMLVSEGTGTDINAFNKVFALGDTGGEYQHTQTIPELASHFHGAAQALLSFVSGAANQTPSSWGSPGTNYPTQSAGNSTPMQWMPPYITVYMWHRTA